MISVSQHMHLLAHTSIDLGRILNHSFFHMVPDLQQELLDPPPSNTAERDERVAIWTTRLNNIKSALGNFPTLRNPSATTTPRSSSGATAPMRSIPSSQARGTDHLEHGQYACIITGREMFDGFSIKVAHVIPYALVKNHGCRTLDFWKMLEMFYGTECTDTIFAAVAGNINCRENLVALDNSIDTLFENGRLSLTPKTLQGAPISVTDGYTGDYLLSVDYREWKHLNSSPQRRSWAATARLGYCMVAVWCLSHIATTHWTTPALYNLLFLLSGLPYSV
ncbi:hypothetical protein L873DRAFT_1789588 [Choiromyces venosus 120613-1]|uniref:HNH nuclease domain-containing protein n=1 Tax=Choiromyces venosus 120613-1 TaxID=1336337 RepID=A0A3N4JMH1_9PEZI|nr:hypothetical protein L873DRAFT_1789588 [Choiromyces venosus 120613-1]